MHQSWKNSWAALYLDYLLVSQGYFPCKEPCGSSFTSWPNDRKKTHDATWQSWRSWLLQVALSKAGRIYLESLQHCYDLCEKTLGIMDLALGTDMCSTVTTCTFFSLRVHMGSMSSLETNAEWVAKMTMLNSQDFSHNVHIYTALQKDQAAWLC